MAPTDNSSRANCRSRFSCVALISIYVGETRPRGTRPAFLSRKYAGARVGAGPPIWEILDWGPDWRRVASRQLRGADGKTAHPANLNQAVTGSKPKQKKRSPSTETNKAASPRNKGRKIRFPTSSRSASPFPPERDNKS